MRHGRPLFQAKPHIGAAAASELGDILLVASITKTLSQSGTRNLPHPPPPLSDLLLLQILRTQSLHPSKKLDFFKWSSLTHSIKHSPATFSHILRTACRAGFLSEIPGLLNIMKQHAVMVDSGTFKSLLDAFIRAGKFDMAIEILDIMQELGAELSTDMYNSVLVALVRKGQLGMALSILVKLLEGGSSQVPNCIACNELLVGLRKGDMRVEFKQVFDKLRGNEWFEMDTWGYNICIHAFGCWGDLGTSLSLFKEMKDLNSDSVFPDLSTYNSLIHVLCLVGKVDDAVTVWEELKCSGHEPDAITYRILIQGCCKCYRIEEATKIFSEMQNNGYNPDTVVYNSLMDGLFKARKVNEGCQMFERMVQYGVRASTWTYNILIDGLFRNARAEAAYTIFCDLKKKGQFVDGVTYSIVALQLCREGLLEEALELVEEMEMRGFTVDLVTISTLMIGLYKHSRWDWTDKLMKRIRDGNLLPSVLRWKVDMEATMKAPQSKKKDLTPLFPSKGDFSDVLSLISSAASKMDGVIESDDAGVKDDNNSSTDIDQWSSSPHMDHLANQLKSTDHASQLFSLSRGQRVQAKGESTFDIDMVNTFLSLFLAKGKLSIACKLFEIFSDAGANPVSYTYNSILSSFVKKGYFNEAWGVLSEMGEKVCPTDIATYNMIIQGLGKMGRADLASSVLDKLMKQGGYLDVVMYNTLINALGKANRIDEVNKLFKQMKSSGINPDVVTFNTLIEVHSKAGRLKDAYKFLKMMLDSGCTPNHVTDTTLDFLGKEIEKSRYQKASFVRNKDDS
ncbi:putative tetratricopeptide-like helical domain-containing protein [Rosa chinensis]|uniref:Putative tetratricopeptide-like helical domain-containing protein n=1 Tax=Rosa chinensis TaxID=74649 RepID=A0A2P6SJ19_ROSCH|nr:pentatricopeptide repeat-containing protein At4g01570 [Rosa chinensis]PRQ58667.1 putative tetratricopeptide-like helical domain-containing protein [Rosa chinensis]